MEAHAAAQAEGVGAPVHRDFPALGQHRRDLGVLAQRDKPLDALLQHRVGVLVTVAEGIGSADVRVHRNPERVANRAGGTGSEQRRKSRQRGAEGEDKAAAHGAPIPPPGAPGQAERARSG